VRFFAWEEEEVDECCVILVNVVLQVFMLKICGGDLSESYSSKRFIII
jgi:hypothetical protein